MAQEISISTKEQCKMMHIFNLIRSAQNSHSTNQFAWVTSYKVNIWYVDMVLRISTTLRRNVVAYRGENISF